MPVVIPVGALVTVSIARVARKPEWFADCSPRRAQNRSDRRATNNCGCVVGKLPILRAGKLPDERTRLAPVSPVTEYRGRLCRANRQHVSQKTSQLRRAGCFDFTGVFEKRFDWPGAPPFLAQSGSFAMNVHKR